MINIKNFDNWKCRCSALGNVVTASGNLTDSAKTFLLETFIGETENVTKDIYGKALEKGIACEEDGFKMLNKALYPGKFLRSVKMEIEQGTRKEPSNKFIKGTADTIQRGIIYDVKNAFDRFTFGKAKMTHLYEWQLRGYMMLYKKKQSRLFYCLNNMPEYMIAEEQKKMFYTKRKWVSMEDAGYIAACDELSAFHNYDNKPIEEKFKIWHLEWKKEDDEKIKDCISNARAFLNQQLKERKEQILANKQMMIKANILPI